MRGSTARQLCEAACGSFCLESDNGGWGRAARVARPLTQPGTWSSNLFDRRWIHHRLRRAQVPGVPLPGPAGRGGTNQGVLRGEDYLRKAVLFPLSPPGRGEGCSAPARGTARAGRCSGSYVRRPGAGRGEGPCLRRKPLSKSPSISLTPLTPSRRGNPARDSFRTGLRRTTGRRCSAGGRRRWCSRTGGRRPGRRRCGWA